MKKESFLKKTESLLHKIEYPVKITWSLVFVFILIRTFEYFSFSSQFTVAGFSDYFSGIRYDFLFAGLIGVVLILLFLLLPRKFHKPALIFSIISVAILSLLTLSLSEYYLVTLIPLDHSLLIYPVSDILYIAGSSAGLGIGQILKFLLVVFTSIALPLVLIEKLNCPPKANIPVFLPFLVFVLFFNNITPDIRKFDQNHDFYKRVNKTSYLSKQLILNYKNGLHFSDYDITAIASKYHELVDHHDYLNPQLPFMRANNDADVIGQYFDFNEDKPNFVFLIVESLDRNFSGPDAGWGSFTPFLDSLAKNSLYWSNFLSTSERTFNVLPSSFASLPYGDKGFMSIIEEEPYPDFLSLHELLSHTGYRNNFFYGGWAYFDYKEVFLNEIGVDFILDINGFGKEYTKIDSLEDGFTWGYPDHAVYQRSLEILDSMPYQPRLDIYMTLSMHDPFLPPSPEHWEEVFYNHLELLNISDEERSFYQHRKAQFSTILYADDAIRQFFYDYKQRPEFDNTIFFIYGDHHMPLHSYNPLEKYHVPLIIYSPMLKESKTFPSISSTADITPTLLSMMSKQFNLETPQWVHWLGHPINTSSAFQSNRFIPLMRVNRNIDELLWGKYFLSEGRLFVVNKNMNIAPYSNKKVLSKMKKALKYFNILNDYVCHSNSVYKPLTQRSRD